MRPIVRNLALAVLFVAVGPAWADPGRDESGHGRGRGRGGPPQWAGRGDKDQKEYFKRLEKQQREERKRYEKQVREFEEQRRENRERYEEQVREDAKRAREAAREYREDLREAEREYLDDLPDRGYRGGRDDFRHSGYRGYTPLSPYPAQIAPQPGGFDVYPAQPAYPYGNVGDWLGDGQDGYTYGGNPSPGLGVPYGSGPEVLQDSFAPPTGGRITALADLLVEQAETYLQEFLPKIGVVPESQEFLADGTVLRDSAIRFREAALRGASPEALAAEFRDMEARWQRLEARMARVSRGRIGPNIARNLEMGATIDQIRQLLPY